MHVQHLRLGLRLGGLQAVAGADDAAVVALRLRVGLHGQRGHALARRLRDDGRYHRRLLGGLRVARGRWVAWRRRSYAAPGCPATLDAEAAALVEGVEAADLVLVQAANVLLLLFGCVVALVEEFHAREQARRHIACELGGDVALEVRGRGLEGARREGRRGSSSRRAGSGRDD